MTESKYTKLLFFLNGKINSKIKIGFDSNPKLGTSNFAVIGYRAVLFKNALTSCQLDQTITTDVFFYVSV